MSNTATISEDIQLFNNVAWVETNKNALFPDDPQKTFGFVSTKHPYHGCAFNPKSGSPMVRKSSTIQELSKFADAVTVCCYEKLGNITPIKAFTEIRDNELKNCNITAIGNFAFIGLQHSNDRVKLEASKVIEKWKKLV